MSTQEQYEKRQTLLSAVSMGEALIEGLTDNIEVRDVTAFMGGHVPLVSVTVPDFDQAQAVLRAWDQDDSEPAVTSGLVSWQFYVSDGHRNFLVALYANAPKETRIAALQAEIDALRNEVTA